MTRILAALLIAMPTAAVAHDFYSSWCCSGNPVTGDCKPTAPENLTPIHEGWRYNPTGEVIPYGDTQRLHQTPPEATEPYHVCILHGKLRCVYTPGFSG